MISNGPSRSFTREAVETWLHNLSNCDWEGKIPEKILKQARQFYRNGNLSTLDLKSKQAIVTQKIMRNESYSVIEWNEDKPVVRTSLDDEGKGMVIAVAGLYEIEELIAEIQEDEPLLGQFEDSERPCANFEENTKHEEQTTNTEEKPKSSSRLKLIISLEVSSKKGLIAVPRWLYPEGQEIPVYATNGIENIENADRPSLMRFVAEAIQNGFIFEKDRGSFLLKDWNDVAKLSDETLPEWDNSFSLCYRGEAHLLKHGQRTLNWEIEARSRDESSMTLRESFNLGSHRLGREHSRKISKSRNGATFIRGHGLVRLDKKQVEDFEWWQRNRGDATRAKWPRYMLFSFFARKYLKARPDGNLATWQSSIQKLQTNGVGKRFSFLRPYQKRGVAHLHALHQLGCHGLLADEMGLGKTVQALALLAEKKANGLPDLVACPASVVPVWAKEAKVRFPNLRVSILSKDNLFGEFENTCLWVASYTQLRRNRHILDNQSFRYAILDEAQLIKNPKAKVTQTCLAIDAKHRLALSGTPIENSALDLWTIFRFLMPGLLGPRKEFEENLQNDPEKTGDLLRKQVSPFILRRLKSEVAQELPPKLETELPCPLNEEQKKEYRRLTDGAISKNGESLRSALEKSPTHFFSLLTRLRQACCDVALLPSRENRATRGSKSDLLIEKLSDLSSSGAKIIVFSQFTSFLAILRKDIAQTVPEIKVLELTGSSRNRAEPIEAFEKHKGPVVILASLKAAGLGISLKSADYVFLMDPWWNPAVEEQAIDRAHRLGRQKPTFIYRLVARGTIEERVRQLQLVKKETFRQIIGELEQVSGLTAHFSSLKELIEFKES